MKQATLRKIYQALNNPNSYHKEESINSLEKVSSLVTYPVSEYYTEFIKPSSRKTVYLQRTLAVINKLKQRRIADPERATLISLSSRSKWMIALCGSDRNARRLIDFMSGIGLISVFQERYYYNENKEHEGCSKSYLYYYCNELKVVQFCHDHEIEMYKHDHVNEYNRIIKKYNKEILNINNESLVDTFTNLHFSSKHSLYRYNMTQSEFEAYLTVKLHETYPEMIEYEHLADEINQTYYKDQPDLQISFRPTFTWSKNKKKVTKIGIRATNSLVSLKADTERKDYCNDNGLNLHYDVKSSVPRLTYWLNTGNWLSDSVDFYERIYKNMNIREDYNTMRPIIKSLHMRGYFDKETELSKHICNAAKVRDEDKSISQTMTNLRNAITKAEGGKLYDNEIFYYESIVYMNVLKDLLDQDFQVYQVYDSWYAKKDQISNEEYSNIVNKCIHDSLNKVYHEMYFHEHEHESNSNKEIINNNKEILNINNEILNINNESLVDTFTNLHLNKEIMMKFALEHSYKDFNAKYHKSKRTYVNYRNRFRTK